MIQLRSTRKMLTANQEVTKLTNFISFGHFNLSKDVKQPGVTNTTHVLRMYLNLRFRPH